MNQLKFSGHETFHCRTLWLKKGYEFIKRGEQFSDEEAVGFLGVGKNMVLSIRYWLKSFGIIDDKDQLLNWEIKKNNNLGYFLFEKDINENQKGFDPYLEDHATLWLLHYYLIKTNRASIFSQIFNYFRKERVEFTKDNIFRFLKRVCEEHKYQFNEKTIINDINVFIKTYYRPSQITKNIEDEFSGLLIELNLIKTVRGEISQVVPRYSLLSEERSDIPWQLILYTILEFSKDNLISFNDLLIKPYSPGLVFAMNADGLMKKINEITDKNKFIHFTDDNGIRELKFEKRPTEKEKWRLLERYYVSK